MCEGVTDAVTDMQYAKDKCDKSVISTSFVLNKLWSVADTSWDLTIFIGSDYNKFAF
jgi:hypothetical protein